MSDLCISTDFFVNIAVQFSSQIRPTERSDPEASLLKTWAVVDALDRDGMGSVEVAMDSMWSPLGNRTDTDGLLIGESVLVGSLDDVASRKWPVAPVSALMTVVVCGADIVLRSKNDFKAKLHFLTLSRILF